MRLMKGLGVFAVVACLVLAISIPPVEAVSLVNSGTKTQSNMAQYNRNSLLYAAPQQNQETFLDRVTAGAFKTGVFLDAVGFALQAGLVVVNTAESIADSAGSLYSRFLRWIGKENEVISLSDSKKHTSVEKLALTVALDERGVFYPGMTAEEKLKSVFLGKTSSGEDEIVTIEMLDKAGWTVKDGKFVPTDAIGDDLYRKNQAYYGLRIADDRINSDQPINRLFVRNEQFEPKIITPNVDKLTLRYEIWAEVVDASGRVQEQYLETITKEHPISWTQFQPYVGKCNVNIPLDDVDITYNGFLVRKGLVLTGVTVTAAVSSLGNGTSDGTRCITPTPMPSTNSPGMMNNPGMMNSNPGMMNTTDYYVPSLEGDFASLHDNLNRYRSQAIDRLNEESQQYNMTRSNIEYAQMQASRNHDIETIGNLNALDSRYVGRCLHESMYDRGAFPSLVARAKSVVGTVFNSYDSDFVDIVANGCSLDDLKQRAIQQQMPRGNPMVIIPDDNRIPMNSTTNQITPDRTQVVSPNAGVDNMEPIWQGQTSGK